MISVSGTGSCTKAERYQIHEKRAYNSGAAKSWRKGRSKQYEQKTIQKLAILKLQNVPIQKLI